MVSLCQGEAAPRERGQQHRDGALREAEVLHAQHEAAHLRGAARQSVAVLHAPPLYGQVSFSSLHTAIIIRVACA